MIVRPLGAADIPALSAAVAALPLMRRYGRTAAALARDWERAAARGEMLFAAVAGEDAVGIAWGLTGGTLGLGGYLRLLAVRESAHRCGAGRALLSAYETAVVAAGSTHAFLLVSEFNVEAQRFYEHAGYRRVGALPALVQPDLTEVLYWKPIGT
ncbi:MAG: GNAT family N-acetyltransferase [Candidatus Binatia bacterium]